MALTLDKSTGMIMTLEFAEVIEYTFSWNVLERYRRECPFGQNSFARTFDLKEISEERVHILNFPCRSAIVLIILGI